MKVLSVRQPWAWAHFHGKPVENRPWKTDYTGPLLIHASLKFDGSGWDWLVLRQELLDAPLPSPDEFTFGAIIGKVNFYALVYVDADGFPSILSEEVPEPQDSYESPFFSGPYGFCFKDARELESPVRCRGMLGLYNVNPNILKGAVYTETRSD